MSQTAVVLPRCSGTPVAVTVALRNRSDAVGVQLAPYDSLFHPDPGGRTHRRHGLAQCCRCAAVQDSVGLRIALDREPGTTRSGEISRNSIPSLGTSEP